MSTCVHPFIRALEVPPGSLRVTAATAWAATVATIAAWPDGEPAMPVIERRLWRSVDRGDLRHVVIAALHDHLGLVAPPEARRDLDELLRPLRHARALRPLSPGRQSELVNLSFRHIAELRTISPWLPEGAHALPALFADLVDGLGSLPGPVALSLAIAPPDALGDQDDEVGHPEDDERQTPNDHRRVRFRLRLCASVPIPVTLRARAEAVCLSQRPRIASWRTALGARDAAAMDGALRAIQLAGWEESPDPLVSSATAALTLALPEPLPARAPRRVEGAPVAGPLPTVGAALGRVPRPGGRRATWRLSWEQRRHHLFVAGASGCGKSTTLLRLALDDFAAGRMVVVVDPHGDFADQVAANAPDNGVWIDPRLETTAPLDLLDRDPARATAYLLSAVTEVWPADFSGPVWQRGISLALRVLSASRGALTLDQLERFIVDPSWRNERIGEVRDLGLRRQAAFESQNWDKGPSGDGSLVNWMAGKITPLTRGPGASLFASPPSRRLERELVEGAGLVVALPLGQLGAATVALAGRMFLTRLTAAISAQAAIVETRRREVSVFIDEAHLLAGPALAALFSQARKFGASITAATQYPSQLHEHLSGVLTNAQTTLVGRLPLQEAVSIRSRLGEEAVMALPTLPRHHLIIGTEDTDPTRPPIVLSPIPPPGPPTVGGLQARERTRLAIRLAADLRNVQRLRAYRASVPAISSPRPVAREDLLSTLFDDNQFISDDLR